ncbi:hypothetical protein ISCGN_013447 [Ixodes scapularis]
MVGVPRYAWVIRRSRSAPKQPPKRQHFSGKSPDQHGASDRRAEQSQGESLASAHAGEELVNAGHIIECSVVVPETTSSSVHVRSYVLQTSALSKDLHTVDLKLTNNATIDELSCTCPAGNSPRCKHCIGVLLHVNRVRQLPTLSSTDVPQSWGQHAKGMVKARIVTFKCSCCEGKIAVLEIKCPRKLQNSLKCPKKLQNSLSKATPRPLKCPEELQNSLSKATAKPLKCPEELQNSLSKATAKPLKCPEKLQNSLSKTTAKPLFYTQVQVQMGILGIDHCKFFVYESSTVWKLLPISFNKGYFDECVQSITQLYRE